MFVNLRFVMLHDPMFLNATNLGTKLDPTKRAGLFLQFDKKEREVVVWYNGKPQSVKNWAGIEPFDYKDMGWELPSVKIKQQPPAEAAQPNPTIQAQVSTPHSHVFAEAPGQTGLGQKVK